MHEAITGYHKDEPKVPRVAVEATGRGRHVSGKDYLNHYHFLFTWRDGKLLELKEYMDTEAVTEVLCGGVRPEVM